jgi:hypothetical protein
MPITPAIIPANYNSILVKQGAFDADLMNQVNAFTQASDLLVATAVNAALGFAAFNSAAAVTLLPATAPAGFYEVNIYAVLTTAFATNTTWNFSLGFTDDQQAQSPIVLTSATLTQGTAVFAAYSFRSNGAAAITYTPGKTGSAATAGVVAFSLTLQRLL